MTKLICDICGTTYSDTEEKCPTCGYSRGFEELTPVEEPQPVIRERVRGGRFSHKNVKKRLDLLAVAAAQKEQEAAAAELAAMEAEMAARQSENAQPTAEIQQPQEEIQPEPVDPEAEEKRKALLAVYRRDVALNLTLFFALAVFTVSAVYMLLNYGIPFMRGQFRPAAVVTQTQPTEQTEILTETPTQAPTAEPTEEPTEQPTEAPTEAPTETPTVALDSPLTLNYEELTFRGANQGVQLVVDGYDAAQITWTSDDPNVATVSSTGKVISVSNGTTYVHASYGGHTVSCVVYCNFS